jgi:hypothetical protein
MMRKVLLAIYPLARRRMAGSTLQGLGISAQSGRFRHPGACSELISLVV